MEQELVMKLEAGGGLLELRVCDKNKLWMQEATLLGEEIEGFDGRVVKN